MLNRRSKHDDRPGRYVCKCQTESGDVYDISRRQYPPQIMAKGAFIKNPVINAWMEWEEATDD